MFYTLLPCSDVKIAHPLSGCHPLLVSQKISSNAMHPIFKTSLMQWLTSASADQEKKTSSQTAPNCYHLLTSDVKSCNTYNILYIRQNNHHHHHWQMLYTPWKEIEQRIHGKSRTSKNSNTPPCLLPVLFCKLLSSLGKTSVNTVRQPTIRKNKLPRETNINGCGGTWPVASPLTTSPSCSPHPNCTTLVSN